MTATLTKAHDRARTEHLVDQVLAILLPGAVETSRRTILRLIQQAQAARRDGDPRLALATLAGLDLAPAPRDLACRVYGEWLASARQLDLPPGALLHRGATGQAAVLEPDQRPGRLRVVAALGFAWEPGRVLSRACLRSLVPLRAASAPQGGGA